MLSDSDLAVILDGLDVQFLRHDAHVPLKTTNPETLLEALASSEQARLRLALILLLLKHPEFAAYALEAAARLASAPRSVLMCYYTAAYYLQQRAIHQGATDDTVTVALPDLFSQELGLAPTSDSDRGLRSLAACQQVLSGSAINWLGTYEHAARYWHWQEESERV